MSPTSVQPIFLLSLPRSGSTLVQRVLAAHDQIATTPEPWIFLPHAYAMRESGMAAEYTHPMAARAVREFVEHLDGGAEVYRRALRDFITSLYTSAATDDARYFLDKTPRYHFVIEELIETFPEAKYIYLWRNPLSIVASISETWSRGRWSVGRWEADLLGLSNLIEARRNHADRSIAVNYEQLVTDPTGSWPPIFEFLDLSFDPDLLTSFSSVELRGRMGDPTGVGRYDRLSTEPLDKWTGTLGSPIRKRWCRAYLERIGAARLAEAGYDLPTLLAQLEAAPRTDRSLASDTIRSAYWWLAQRRKQRAFRRMAPRVS